MEKIVVAGKYGVILNRDNLTEAISLLQILYLMKAENVSQCRYLLNAFSITGDRKIVRKLHQLQKKWDVQLRLYRKSETEILALAFGGAGFSLLELGKDVVREITLQEIYHFIKKNSGQRIGESRKKGDGKKKKS